MPRPPYEAKPRSASRRERYAREESLYRAQRFYLALCTRRAELMKQRRMSDG